MWKFRGKAQFPLSLSNSPKTMRKQNFHTRKLGEITLFFVVFLAKKQFSSKKLKHIDFQQDNITIFGQKIDIKFKSTDHFCI